MKSFWYFIRKTFYIMSRHSHYVCNSLSYLDWKTTRILLRVLPRPSGRTPATEETQRHPHPHDLPPSTCPTPQQRARIGGSATAKTPTRRTTIPTPKCWRTISASRAWTWNGGISAAHRSAPPATSSALLRIRLARPWTRRDGGMKTAVWLPTADRIRRILSNLWAIFRYRNSLSNPNFSWLKQMYRMV